MITSVLTERKQKDKPLKEMVCTLLTTNLIDTETILWMYKDPQT